MKPSVSSGVFCILFAAVGKKYAAGGKKHYVKKKPAGGIKKENADENSEPVGDKNKNHPPETKSPQKNRRVILTRLFLTSSLS